MVEIIVGVIAGFFLLLNTVTTQRTQKQLKVSNGNPPGMMIEKTYDIAHELQTTVHEIDKRLEVHTLDQQAHCKITTHGHG